MESPVSGTGKTATLIEGLAQAIQTLVQSTERTGNLTVVAIRLVRVDVSTAETQKSLLAHVDIQYTPPQTSIPVSREDADRLRWLGAQYYVVPGAPPMAPETIVHKLLEGVWEKANPPEHTTPGFDRQ